MDYSVNPFPGDRDRHALWEMLVRRDIGAFLAQDWSMVADDFLEDRFFGLHAHDCANPDSWRLGFPSLAVYRDEWLRQSAQTAARSYGEPLKPALFRITTLRDIDLGDGVAVVRKKFDGFLQCSDGTRERLCWQTLYFCTRLGGSWKISSFIGYLPHPLGHER